MQYIQEFYQTVRDHCFKLCITSPGSSLSSSEQKCLGRCMDRYQDGRTKARIARASTQWLDVRQFSSSEECMQQLKSDGWRIWATDLSPGALALSQPNLQLPPKLAVVMGSEAKGVSAAVRAAADRCVFLPMYGFTESLNVSVATALVLQTLIAARPSVRGDLIGGEQRAAELEAKWTAVTQGRQQQGTAAADALDAGCLEVQQSNEE
eukprot:gene5274-5509_t